MTDAPLVLSIPSYEPLATRLREVLSAEAAAVERRRFDDGETYQRLTREVRGRDVVLVAGTCDERDTLLAFDLACAAARYGARRLTWVLPYFGCQTMERSVRPGEVVTAKTRARIISAVPPTPHGNRVLLLDLHSEGIPYYFGDAVHAFHLYGKPLVMEAARAFGGEGLLLAAPDAGRAKWVESLANDLGVRAAFVYKRRLASGATEVTGVNAEVRDSTVVIYDDMIRSGGTLMQAARAYLDAGAARCFAVTTHLVLPGDALERLLASGLFAGLAGTDSHPRAEALRGQAGLTIRSVAGLFARWILEDRGAQI